MLVSFSYHDRHSLVEKTDPRARWIFSILVMFAITLFWDIRILLFFLALTMGQYYLARLTWKETHRAWKFIFFIMSTMVVVNTLITSAGTIGEVMQGGHPIIQFSLPILGWTLSFTLTIERLWFALTQIVRILSISALFLVIPFTMDPRQYGATFRGMGVPDRLAYSLDLAFRFVPTLSWDFQITLDAQRARGYEVEKLEGGLISQIRKMAPLVVPVTMNAILSGEDITKRAPNLLTDVFRTIPGLRVTPSGTDYVVESARNAMGGCVRYWVDGAMWEAVFPGDVDRRMPPWEIGAIEVYNGTSVPAQFQMAAATVLVELQRRLPRPVVDYFDVVAGTSTGGLVASAVCAPGPSGGPRYTPQQILEFYVRDCRQIFHRSPWWFIESLGGMRRPKYPARGIEAFLSDRFGDTELRHALKPLVMVSYDLTRRAPWVFSSVLAAEETSRNYLLRDACRASTAAPTYFPAGTVCSFAGDCRELVDGGVCANDPVLAAFVVAERLHPGRPLALVSLNGCRHSPHRLPPTLPILPAEGSAPQIPDRRSTSFFARSATSWKYASSP